MAAIKLLYFEIFSQAFSHYPIHYLHGLIDGLRDHLARTQATVRVQFWTEDKGLFEEILNEEKR
jgi:hypothetical protein